MDALTRWIRWGRELRRRPPANLPDSSLVSPEVWDLLRQLERGLDLRETLGAGRKRRPADPGLDGVSAMAPVSSGLGRIRRAILRARRGPGGRPR
jgi:hypothetical protein